ncbi:hypothetical protein F5Y19DRAFT_481908 [Xylariaceae sp. FL1651]|nr:hypothetical protein F5Y19DRAFT_481908 [Xylariaceae sp. FL1651]
MSFEKGRPLWDFWKDASPDERETVIGHLRTGLAEMRNIKGDYVGGFNRNPCTSDEFRWDMDLSGSHKYGPYADEYAFHEDILEAYARAHPRPLNTDPESDQYNKIYATRQLVHSLRGHEIVFTHGDLNASNILIQDDLSVVIVDWNSAGFFPAYWEWYKATRHGVFAPSFIRQVERYIPPYWGGDKRGEDPPAHIALAVHENIPQPKLCHLHYARCPDQVKFIYKSQPSQLFNTDAAPRGRCNLRADLSAEQAQFANEILASFGANEMQLPYFGEGNCHNWAAGAFGALEKAGLAMPGDGEYWRAMIGMGPAAMETRWKEVRRREWVAVVSETGESDGALPNFRDRVGRLQQLLRGN